ncbi:unnamed protein product [Victoria cruziana]
MGHHQSSTPVSQKRAMKPDQESLKKITSLPNWKFYGNPFYHHHHGDEEEQARDPRSPHDHRAAAAMDHPTPDEAARYQRRIKALEEQQARTLSLVSSLRSELDLARTKIAELRSVMRALQGELESEIGIRKRLESANKSLSKELEKERISKEVVEGVCDELAREIGKDRAEVEDMRRECERVRVEVAEERRMLRIAEVWREERVQMKLAEARRILEQRISDIDVTGCQKSEPRGEEKKIDPPASTAEAASAAGGCGGGGGGGGSGGGGPVGWNKPHLTENPHIQRGMKGFVEFPRVVRQVGPKGRRVGSTKAECQKALLRQYILKQRVPVGLSASGPENLVMG